MRLVAVSQRVAVFTERKETCDMLDQHLAAFIVAAGYLPVPVPNNLGGAIRDWLVIVQPAAILLSGGNDIGQCPERDVTETILLQHAETNGLPLLGICRGMQMLAHHAGTGLIPVSGHVRTRHVLTGEIEGEMNSYHGYALEDCPENYVVLAHSEDGAIEAIRHREYPWEGWMWHPEREQAFAANDIQRLQRLFS